MSISYETGYYHNNIVVKDGNTKVTLDISNGRKSYCQGYFADKSEAENIFSVIDEISEDVENSEEIKQNIPKIGAGHIKDLMIALKELKLPFFMNHKLKGKFIRTKYEDEKINVFSIRSIKFSSNDRLSGGTTSQYYYCHGR